MENDNLLENQAKKVLKEEVFLQHSLDELSNEHLIKMLEYLEYQRVILMMQCTSRMGVVQRMLKKRGVI